MNENFPPLFLSVPQTRDRIKIQRNIQFQVPEEIVENRKAISENLKTQIEPLSEKLKEMSDEERKAVFYKLEHEGNVSLSGTGLKPIAESTEKITIAVPRKGNLDPLLKKVKEFGEELNNDVPQNSKEIANLRAITEGQPKDRLSQELFEKYDEIIEKDLFIFELEIMANPLLSGVKQQQEDIRNTLNEINDKFENNTRGRILEHEEFNEKICRAVISCSGKLFQEFVEEKHWQVKISWIDTRPEFKFYPSVITDFDINSIEPLNSPDETAPIVCIIDSGISPGNPFLNPVTKEEWVRCFLNTDDDPDKFTPYDEVKDYGHGSGVASLASYYALNSENGAENQGKVWIASARILDRNNECDERLYSKMLRDVVETFAPLGIKIFNLSINSKDRKWNEEAKRTVPRQSWTARAIDKLSREFDVVFVVSAGNIHRDLIDEFFQNDADYPNYLADENSCILDPAQSALSLTVGSIARTTLVAQTKLVIESPVAKLNYPSPFTRIGPGIKKEIKPELVEYGGNLVIDENKDTFPNVGTNIVMATNKISPAITTSCGTSYAAPRVTHKLALIMSDLQSLGIGNVSAPLLRALIVNSASYDFLGEDLSEFIETIDGIQAKHWQNILGYGQPDDVSATYCDDYSVLLFFQGEIESDKVMFFDIPVPESLADADFGTKQLSVTLAFSPEVQKWGIEEYLGTTIKWRVFRGDTPQQEIVNAMSQEDFDESGVEGISVLTELRTKLGITLRSKGTVQHDIAEWSKHQREYSANNYTLAVVSQKRWTRITSPVPFGIVVRLQDKTRSASIYSEVRNILTNIQIQT